VFSEKNLALPTPIEGIEPLSLQLLPTPIHILSIHLAPINTSPTWSLSSVVLFDGSSNPFAPKDRPRLLPRAPPLLQGLHCSETR